MIEEPENNYSSGWVRVFRSLTSKGYYKRSNYVHLWVHILLKANHKGSKFFWKGQEYTLKPGQFITGRNKLSEETGISPSTIERILKCFESEQQIGQRKTNGFRLISVTCWDEYQQSGQANGQRMDSEWTASGQRVDTYNNDKNNKNDNNTFSSKDKKGPYGNPEINQAINFLKEQLPGGILDGTVKGNRQAAHRLIQKIKKGFPGSDPVESVKLIIQTGLNDPFHAKNLTSFAYLDKHFQKLLNNGKQKQAIKPDPIKQWESEMLKIFGSNNPNTRDKG